MKQLQRGNSLPVTQFCETLEMKVAKIFNVSVAKSIQQIFNYCPKVKYFAAKYLFSLPRHLFVTDMLMEARCLLSCCHGD